MYLKLNGKRVKVSTVEGTVPELSQLDGIDVAVNIPDRIMFYVNLTGEIESMPLQYSEVKSITGIESQVEGDVTLDGLSELDATIVTAKEIGNIVSAGDIVVMPYGDYSQVLFTVGANVIVIEGRRNKAIIQGAAVYRKETDSALLDNASRLSLIWDGKIDEVIPIQPYHITLFEGQSLIIGTLNGEFNEPRVSPIIFDATVANMINGVGTIGNQEHALDISELTELIPLTEYSANPQQDGYHSPATGMYSRLPMVDRSVLLQSGAGGRTIEELGVGGSVESASNTVKQIEYIKSLHAESTVDSLVFIHGGANWRDSKSEYLGKQDAFIAERITVIKELLPKSNPHVIITQHGGEQVTFGVQTAQLEAARRGSVTCTGATYHLNRKYPNVSLDDVARVGTGSPERIHLNADGYDVLGDMVARAIMNPARLPFHVISVDWIDESTVKLNCNVPEGHIVTGATDTGMPLFEGEGIEVYKPNGIRIPASTVTAEGSGILCTFPTDVLVGDRIQLGLTPRDISYHGDYTPVEGKPTYAGNHLIGTNIRLDVMHTAVNDLNYYDWLCSDAVDVVKNSTTPDTMILGSNIFRTSEQGYPGFGERWVISSVDGTTTKTLDGVDYVSPTTRSLGASTNKEVAAWGVRAGHTYRLEFDLTEFNDLGRLQFTVGNKGITVTSGSLVGNHFSGDVVAEVDHQYSLSIRENSGSTLADINATIENVSIREVINP